MMHTHRLSIALALFSLSIAAGAHAQTTPPLPSMPPLEAMPATVPPPSGGDPFIDALSNVYRNHPQLQAQREAVEAVDEGVAQAVSGFRPDIIAGYAEGRERVRGGNQNWNYGKARDKSLVITQPIFSGGETLANYSSAKSRVKAARAQLTAVEQQVLYTAIAAYADLYAKQSLLEVNQHNVDVLSKQLEATNARFDVGELTRTDTAQSQARLASAQAAERQALGALDSARATFKRVIGYDPPATIDLPPLPAFLPHTIEEAVEWARAADPTLETAMHLEKAASSDVNARTASLLPDVAVQGSMNRTSGNTLPGSFRSDNDALTLNIVIPLYQSGAEWSRIREARDIAAQARFTTMDTLSAVTENVSIAWQDYHTARAVIASTEKAVDAARIALEGVHQENQYGTRTILDVLDAEQEMFIARLNLLNARVAEKQFAYRLLAAAGRLTAQDLKLPVALEDPKAHYDKVKYQLIGF